MWQQRLHLCSTSTQSARCLSEHLAACSVEFVHTCCRSPDDAELTDDDLSGAEEDLAGDQHPVAALCPAGIDCILLQGPWHGPAPLCGLSLVCPPQHCIGSRTAAWSWCLPHCCLFRASQPGRMTTPAHHCSYVSRRGGCCRALAAGCPEPGGWQLCAAKLKLPATTQTELRVRGVRLGSQTGWHAGLL